MLKKLIQTSVGAATMLAITATQASAGTLCFWGICIPVGGEGGGEQHAPEINASEGLAAVAVLICVALVLREKFLRARAS